MRHSTIYAFVAGILLALSLIHPGHAQTAAVSSPNGEASRASAPDTHRIGPEGRLLVSVGKNPALARRGRVRPGGHITLPRLNDVEAGGLTPNELRELLSTKLANYMPSPEVSVIVIDIRSFKISIMGEVAKPGRYELKGWATVLDALALAGGFTQFASRSRIVILHYDGKTMKRIPINYNKVAAGEQENFYLRNGDIILVT